MTLEEIMNDLEENVYCRLQPSSIAGIGVFAIRDIPSGTLPIKSSRPSFEYVPISLQSIMDNPRIASGAKDMVRAFCVIRDGVAFLPPFSLNDIYPNWFLNHSEQPNMRYDEDTDDFAALRDIKAGEELTSDYRTYTDE